MAQTDGTSEETGQDGLTEDSAIGELEAIDGLFDDDEDEDEDEDADDPDALGDEDGDEDDGEAKAELGDEDGEEDTDDGDDEDSDADKDEDADPDKAKGSDRFITVTDPVDGKTKRITESEAAAGWMRTADYTRKTQAAAAIRKEAEAKRDEYGALVTQYREFLDSALKNEPDWEKLKEEAPEKYLLAKDEWNQVQAERERAKAEEARVKDEQGKEQQAKLLEFAQEQTKLLHEKLPAWKNPKVAKQEAAAMQKGLLEAGYSEDEVSDVLRSLIDHRAVLLLRDAMLYRQSKAKAGKKVRPAGDGKRTLPSAAAPAPTRRTTNRKRLRDAARRLERSGSTRDAAAVFEQMPGLFDDGDTKRRR